MNRWKFNVAFNGRSRFSERIAITKGISVACILMAVACVHDFYSRVFVASTTAEQLHARGIAPMGVVALPPANLEEVVGLWFPQLGQGAETQIKKIKLQAISRGRVGWSAVLVLVGASEISPPQVVRVGDTINGWSVESIGPKEVNLRRGGETSRERLFDRT